MADKVENQGDHYMGNKLHEFLCQLVQKLSKERLSLDERRALAERLDTLLKDDSCPLDLEVVNSLVSIYTPRDYPVVPA